MSDKQITSHGIGIGLSLQSVFAKIPLLAPFSRFVPYGASVSIGWVQGPGVEQGTPYLSYSYGTTYGYMPADVFYEGVILNPKHNADTFFGTSYVSSASSIATAGTVFSGDRQIVGVQYGLKTDIEVSLMRVETFKLSGKAPPYEFMSGEGFVTVQPEGLKNLVESPAPYSDGFLSGRGQNAAPDPAGLHGGLSDMGPMPDQSEGIRNLAESRASAVDPILGTSLGDLPPLKWSSLRYDFRMEDKIDGKEEAYG